jgi:toxin ParE1/3/4
MRILWTRQARNDVRAIRAFISRDAPLTASAFMSKVRHAVERLKDFPYSGQVVREIAREEIREVLREPYRIIYRITSDRVEILMVYHSSRLLDEPDIEPDSDLS